MLHAHVLYNTHVLHACTWSLVVSTLCTPIPARTVTIFAHVYNHTCTYECV